MAFDLNNFVVDHILRGMMFSTADGSYMWSINQITDPSLSITAETADAVDALGSKIATFNRGKSAEFSANNSLFDLALYAAQNGTEKKVATATNKLTVPAFETITVPAVISTSVKLKNTPKATPQEIYVLKGDGTLGAKLTYSSTAGDGKFTYASGAITFPTNDASGTALVSGTDYFVQYEYDTDAAVAVTGNAVDFPKAGKFIMEVLGTDVCDPTTLIHAYLVFPRKIGAMIA